MQGALALDNAASMHLSAVGSWRI